jgi:hypothetical protein
VQQPPLITCHSTSLTQVPFEQLTLEKVIGEGAMGVVYRARFRSAVVAVKLIKTHEFMDMDSEEDMET